MKPKLYGLILVGGRSIRMGRDKALISYNGTETQLERTSALLKVVCQNVFVSQRKDQNFESRSNTNIIYDSVKAVKGPLRGILSAMHSHPNDHWLVIACDLPNLEVNVLKKLVHEFTAEPPQLIAYKSSFDDLPEPLCAIYPAGSAKELIAHSRMLNTYCPRKILIAKNIRLIEQDNPKSLNNVNTISEYYDSMKNT